MAWKPPTAACTLPPPVRHRAHRNQPGPGKRQRDGPSGAKAHPACVCPAYMASLCLCLCLCLRLCLRVSVPASRRLGHA